MSSDILERILAPDFDVLAWLNVQTESTVMARLLERVPADIDVSVGSYEWDAIYPTALEFSVAYFAFIKAVKTGFPQLTFGKYLKDQARSRGVIPIEAQPATGFVHITGTPGASIPAGSKFSSTVASGSTDIPKYYMTVSAATIGDDGTVDVAVEADVPGTSGNVKAGEVNLNIQNIPGILTVSNTQAIKNGLGDEEDEALLKRLLERVRNPPSSGNASDYVRWAKEVPGVGDAIIQRIWNGPGTVKIVIVGANGEPIPERIEAVENYIDPMPKGTGAGKAPVGATVTVTTVASTPIKVTIPGIQLDAGYILNDMKPLILTALQKYMAQIPAGGIIRRKGAEAAIKALGGVLDFGDILFNDQSDNITLAIEEKAAAGDVEYV